MATLTERLRFLIDLDSDAAVKGFQKVGSTAEAELKKADSGLSRTGTSLTKFGVGAMAFAGIAGAALFSFAKMGDEAEQSQRKLNNTLANSPQLAGVSAQAFNNLAEAIQKKTGVDNDAIVAGEAMLGQFGFTKDQILQLTPLVVDLSAKMGVDLNTAFRQVGKTAETGTNGLSKMGIVFDAGALKADAFGTTIDGLRQKVGGFADQEGKSFTGQMNIMKNELHDVGESIGVGVIGAMRPLVGVVGEVTSAFKGLPQPVQEGIGKFGAFGVAAIGAVGALSFVSGQIIKTVTSIKDFTSWIGKAGTAVTLTGAAVVLAGAAYLAYNSKKQATIARTKELVEAMKEEAAGHADSVTKLVASRLAEDDLVAKGKELGFTTKDLAAIIRGEVVPGFKDFEAATKGNLFAADALAQKYGVSKDTVIAFATGLGTLRGDMARATDETTKNAEAAKVAAGAQQELGVAIAPTTEELKQQADAAKALEDATRGALDAQLGFYDSEIRVREAAQNSKDAQDALAKSVKDHGAISAETASALDRLRSNVLSESAAIVDATVKQSEANGVQLTASDRISANVMALEGLKKKYPELSGQIDVWIAGLSRQKANANAAGVDIGAAIPAGINRGIGAGLAGSIESIQSMVDAIIAAGKARAGIKSPSTVAADEIGQPMAEGVGVGIDTGTPKAKAASKKLVDGVVKHMDNAVLSAYGAGKATGDAFTQGVNDAPKTPAEFLVFVEGEIERRVQAAKDRMAHDKFDSIVDVEVNKRLGAEGVPDQYKTKLPDTAATVPGATTTAPSGTSIVLQGDVHLDGTKVGTVIAEGMNVRAA